MNKLQPTFILEVKHFLLSLVDAYVNNRWVSESIYCLVCIYVVLAEYYIIYGDGVG
jgi:hypothetical protein